MARIDFDANAVPPNERLQPIPVGNYLLQVIESEIRQNNKGTGELLKLTLQVLDGPYANRLIFDNLNIVNDSPKAQEIANRSLADLCLLLGIVHCQDSEELHFKPFQAYVGIREDKTGQYAPQNTVRYRRSWPTPAPAHAQGTVVTPSPAPLAPSPAPQGNGTPRPWHKPAAAPAPAPAARGSKPPF
jgi:Protein of unknown function (DUF669)